MSDFINSIKENFLIEYVPLNTKKGSFCKPTENCLVKLQRFSLKTQKKQWADNFFRKIINPHCSSGIRKGSFDNSAGKHSPSVWQFFAQTPKQCRLHPFLKMCSPKKILCISRMKSFFSRYKDVAIRAKSCRSMSKKKKKLNFS